MRRPDDPSSTPSETIPAGIVRMIARAPRAIVILVSLATLLLLHQALSLPLEIGVEDIHPLSHGNGVSEALLERVSAANLIFAVVEGGTLDTRTQFVDAWSLSMRHEHDRQVQRGEEPLLRYVLSRIPLSFLEDRKLLYLDMPDLLDIESRLSKRLNQERLKRNPFYVNLDSEDEPEIDVSFKDLQDKYGFARVKAYTASDNNAIFVLLVKPNNPKNDPARTEQLTRWLQEDGERLQKSGSYPGITFSLGGSAITAENRHDMLDDDVTAAVLIFLGGASLLALVLLRWFRLIGAFWLVVAVPIVLSAALTSLLVPSLTLTACLAFPVAAALGSATALTTLYHYRNARKRELSPEAALTETLRDHAAFVIAALLAAAGAAFLIATVGIAEFRAFGIMAGITLLLYIPALSILLPAIVLWSERARVLVFSEQVWWPDSTPMHMPRRRTVFALGLLISLISLVLVVISYSCWMTPWVEPARRCAPNGPCCKQPVCFEYNFHKLWLEPQESATTRDKFRRAIPLPENPLYAIAPTRDVLHRFVLDMENERKRDDSTFSGSSSVFVFMPDDQEQKFEVLSRIDKLANEDNLSLFTKDVRHRIDELQPLLHPSYITLYQLPPTILRVFSQEVRGGENLLDILSAALGPLPPTISRDDWEEALRLRVESLPVTTLDSTLQSLNGGELAPAGGLASNERARRDQLLKALHEYHEHYVGTVAYVFPEVDTSHGKAAMALKDELDRMLKHHPQMRVGGFALDLASSVALAMRSWLGLLAGGFGLTLLLALAASRRAKATIAVLIVMFTSLTWAVFAMAVFDAKWNIYSLLVQPILAFAACDFGLRLSYHYRRIGQVGTIPAIRATLPAALLSIVSVLLSFSGWMAIEQQGLALFARLAVVVFILTVLASLTLLPAIIETLEIHRQNKRF